MMVEVGEFNTVELNTHALVFSQGWPSWTMALEGLGFSSVNTICSFDSITSRDEFKCTVFSNTLIHMSQLGSWLTDHYQDGIIFIQGPQSFYNNVTKLIDDQYDLPLVFVCSEPKFFSSDCQRISHHEVGGVLNASWSFYFENLTGFEIEKQSIRRVAHQIIDSVQGAASQKLLELYDVVAPPFTTNDLLPWGEKRILINAPSVFAKGDLVLRFLSNKELMNAYDLELTIQKELLDYASIQNVQPTLSFINQVPIKVLRTIGNAVVQSLTKTSDFCEEESTLSVDSELTTKGGNLSSLPITLSSTESIDDDDFSLVGEEEILTDKAARPDDAEADPCDWDTWSVSSFKVNDITPKVCNGIYNKTAHTRFFNAWRGLLERKYRSIVLKSFIKYMKKLYETKAYSWLEHPKSNNEYVRDLEVGLEAITRAANSTWWSWEDGSTLYFWRWPPHLKVNVRDGTPLFVDWDLLPNYKRKQQWPKDEMSRVKLETKIMKVRNRRYITKGYVKSLTGFFAVPKAQTDIRVVYDATKCGLNSALWSPNFWLPTIDSVLRNARSTTWFADIDLGEMFLNYPLDIRIRPYAGVDITELVPRELRLEAIRILERWVRTLMGFCPSPYIATQTFAWGEEIIIGNYTDKNNTFFWDKVIMNLPGLDNYDPTMPWVYRWNSIIKGLPSFFSTYIDDIRSGSEDETSCRLVTRRVASRLNYLGQQDASRKRGHPAKEPRAWTGAKCMAKEEDGLYVFSPQEKWNKAKFIISKLHSHVVVNSNSLLEHKSLERDVGFLCHISRTYPAIFPYLKGFYNSLNSWRIGRNKDGWKISRTAWMELLSGDVAFDNDDDVELSFENRKRKFTSKHQRSDTPETITAVPRLENDINALTILFNSNKPSLRLVRGKRVSSAVYGFGDASGDGFGSTWTTEKGISYRFGIWGSEMDNSSSNFRELANLVDTLIEMANNDVLRGTEIFLFTDNSTSEAAFFNGSSKSELLFNLILRVRKLEMDSGIKIHFCHVSGERMQHQGTDGLSRGNLNVGVMAGRSMLDFVPIHLTAIERSSTLKPWLISWMGESVEFLEPAEWFTRGHDHVKDKWETTGDFDDSNVMQYPLLKKGIFIWTPAPCAAEVAVEELRKARHKRQNSMHLIVVPRLMHPHWRKQLYKASDLVLSLPVGHSAWGTKMFEPLTLAFVFPFLSFRPWQLRGSVQLLELGRELSRVWGEDARREGPILRKLRTFQESIASMSAELAWKVLQSKHYKPVPHRSTRKRRRRSLEGKKGRRKISNK
jgi:hypothetical protein